MVCIGGDGTLDIANRFFHDGIPLVGVPKTIDNDLMGTDITFGFVPRSQSPPKELIGCTAPRNRTTG